MALVGGILKCLALGGCIAGVAIGAVKGIKSNKATSVTNSLTPEAQEKRKQFLNNLIIYKACVPAYFLNSEKEFGTIYICSDRSLHYLEEENSFNWSKTLEELMPLFKEIKQFQIKKEGDSQTYLSFNLGVGEKKFLLDSSYSEENWNQYKGFVHS